VRPKSKFDTLRREYLKGGNSGIVTPDMEIQPSAKSPHSYSTLIQIHENMRRMTYRSVRGAYRLLPRLTTKNISGVLQVAGATFATTQLKVSPMRVRSM
jgi:hypothetical protein